MVMPETYSPPGGQVTPGVRAPTAQPLVESFSFHFKPPSASTRLYAENSRVS